jgi:hypothetical protein
MFHMCEWDSQVLTPKFEEEELAHLTPHKVLQYMITSGVQHVSMNYEHGLSDKVLLMLTWIYLFIYLYIYIFIYLFIYLKKIWSVSIP